MSTKANASFVLGEQLAMAVVQMSRMDKSPKALLQNATTNLQRIALTSQALLIAKSNAETLVNQGISNFGAGILANPIDSLLSISGTNISSYNFTSITNSIQSVSNAISQALHLNYPYGDIYDLGFQLFFAEAQSSTGDPKAYPIATSSLGIAGGIATKPALNKLVNTKALSQLQGNNYSGIQLFNQSLASNLLNNKAV